MQPKQNLKYGYGNFVTTSVSCIAKMLRFPIFKRYVLYFAGGTIVPRRYCKPRKLPTNPAGGRLGSAICFTFVARTTSTTTAIISHVIGCHHCERSSFFYWMKFATDSSGGVEKQNVCPRCLSGGPSLGAGCQT